MGNTVTFGSVMEIQDPRSIHQALDHGSKGPGGVSEGIHSADLGEKRGSVTPSFGTRDTKASGSSIDG